MSEPIQCNGMLTLEFQSPEQPVFDKQDASELTAMIARDLQAVLRIDVDSALVFCAAGFPSEQLLQPNFPIQQNINQYASAALQGANHHHQVLSIGANEGQMPSGLQPQAASQNLLHLPFCLYTRDTELAERFEAQLMHKGMVPPPTYAKLSQLTNATINHANYMTYLDLMAMMHNHYDQLGLAHLWQLIETALIGQQPKEAVITPTPNHFFLLDHWLFSPFFSWSQFHRWFQQPGTDAYIHWLMAQRLSLGAFVTHGLEIKAFSPQQWPIDGNQICLGSFETQRIKKAYWQHQVAAPKLAPNEVIHYHDPQAGVVAISVPDQNDELSVFYPITPQGIAAIEKRIESTHHNTLKHSSMPFAQYADWLI